ncbi:hypothetical protein [Streptomyces sp. NRRL F-4489]|uniref:imine reductase family protein n=1 Tax=Streptomyces sp. NRRL F-4489 TaxID=1609095 RepID=UPI003B634C80
MDSSSAWARASRWLSSHWTSAARRRGARTGHRAAELLKGLMERTAAAGHGSDSYASVIEVLRRPTAA